MSLNSVLKPPEAVSVGLAEAAAVYVIYNSMLPNHADIGAAPAHDQTIEQARKKAAWTSAALLAFVFMITQDLNSFWIGGLALTGVDLMSKHANGLNPQTGKLQAPGASITAAADNSESFPMPDYADSASGY